MRVPGAGDHPAAGIVSCDVTGDHLVHAGLQAGVPTVRRWLDVHSCAVTKGDGSSTGHAPDRPAAPRPGRPATLRAIARIRARKKDR